MLKLNEFIITSLVTVTLCSGREDSSFQKGGRGQAQKIFVRGFDTSLGEDDVIP